MTNIIYCRVSTIGQNNYNKSVSLQAQEQICMKYAHENNLRVKTIYKEVHSVFNQTTAIMDNITNEKNKTIIISSVDRFSRSVNIGIKIATQTLENKNKIIFIQENFICQSNDDLPLLKSFLQNSEHESTVTGNRIKKAKSFLVDNGMFTGGSIPYGYDIIDRKLVKNLYEQKIIKFIKTCRDKKILCYDLNTQMKELTTDKIYIPINCYNRKGRNIKNITEPISFRDIADLLNSYGVLKRKNIWNPWVVKTAIKEYQPKVAPNKKRKLNTIEPEKKKEKNDAYLFKKFIEFQKLNIL